MCEGILHAPNLSPVIAQTSENLFQKENPNKYFPSKAFGFNNESQGLLTHIFLGDPGFKETWTQKVHVTTATHKFLEGSMCPALVREWGWQTQFNATHTLFKV